MFLSAVWAGKPEVGEWDEQPGGWSEVSLPQHMFLSLFNKSLLNNMLPGEVSHVIPYTPVLWSSDRNSRVIYLGKLQLTRGSLVWMCYTVGNIPLVTEMPGEWDNNYWKYQMSSQTGLKWPKKWVFADEIITMEAAENYWSENFQMSEPVPVLLVPSGRASHDVFMEYFTLRFCACQANRGESGGDLTSPGDLCWESPTTGELSSLCFLRLWVL